MAKTPEEKAAEKAAKDAAKAAEKEAKAAAKAAEKAAQSADGDSITVRFRDHAGNPTERTFSLADHGENFADLAEQFKTKHASRVIA